jgi:hypothetical protein
MSMLIRNGTGPLPRRREPEIRRFLGDRAKAGMLPLGVPAKISHPAIPAADGISISH